MSLFLLPAGYARIRVVNSFDELAATAFEDGVNALCWPRTLEADFGEVAGLLRGDAGITALDPETLTGLSAGLAGRSAIEIMLEDLRLLREHGAAPELNCIGSYPRETNAGPVRTDVYSFHADSAMTEADTWLCTYYGAPSEGLRNDEACRKVDIPEIRSALLHAFGGRDDGEFTEYLNDNCYDLHYSAQLSARPFSFGLGNLWRIAVDYPGCPVPPGIHRAPETGPDSPPRLLLIG